MAYTHLRLAAATAYGANLPELKFLEKSDSLYFKNGDLVLATESTLYRVHRDALEDKCSFFQDLPVIPEGALKGDDSQRYWEDLPVVPLQDDPVYLDVFLNMLLSTT